MGTTGTMTDPTTLEAEGTSAADPVCTCRPAFTPEDPCGHGDTCESCPTHDPDYYDDSQH